MYVLEWRTVYALTKGLFWCLFPELRSIKGNKQHDSTRVSAQTVHHESTYISLFLTRHNESIKDDKNGDPHTSTPCLTRSVYILLMTSQSIADDVTMTEQLWRDRVNIVISNSLDIDFIHSDIQRRSWNIFVSHLWTSYKILNPNWRQSKHTLLNTCSNKFYICVENVLLERVSKMFIWFLFKVSEAPKWRSGYLLHCWK